MNASRAALWVSPLDRLRSTVLREIGPWAAPLFRDRDLRVTWLGVFSVAFAFVTSATVPLWNIALGPVILGVPHLLADVRYLVVRPGLHRRHWLMLATAVPLLLASLGAGPAFGLAAVVPMVLGARAPWHRLVPTLLGWLGLTALAVGHDVLFQLVFLHAHNLVGLALWWWWRPRKAKSTWVVVSAVAGTVLLLTGAADPLLEWAGGSVSAWSQTSFDELMATTTPVENLTLAKHLVLSFAFLQSVHYVAWLRLIPEDDRPRVAPRPFAASLTSLWADFGAWPLALFAAAVVALAGWALVDLAEARAGYLRVAAFHGYLELAVAARWLASGRSGVNAQ